LNDTSSDRVPRAGHCHCCDLIAERLQYVCPDHKDPFDCPDSLVYFSPEFREYGLIIHDGGHSYVTIQYCPWCGARLPESLRDRWFDEVEALGFHDPEDPHIPEEYRTDAWYQEGAA
jgi:hypothetical protein